MCICRKMAHRYVQEGIHTNTQRIQLILWLPDRSRGLLYSWQVCHMIFKLFSYRIFKHEEFSPDFMDCALSMSKLQELPMTTILMNNRAMFVRFRNWSKNSPQWGNECFCQWVIMSADFWAISIVIAAVVSDVCDCEWKPDKTPIFNCSSIWLVQPHMW